MTTPAMTAQEALAAMDQPEWGTPEDVEAVRAALSDAERRATEAGERIASLSRNLMDHERELSAVEARCGLMEKLVRAVGGSATKNHVPKGWFAERDSILAYPGGKSDQGEKHEVTK